MTDQSTYKQIIGYVDAFHEDISQLVILVEQLMADAGYEALATAGNRSGFGLTSHLSTPHGWRLPHVVRWYAPDGKETFETSRLFLIDLAEETPFEFPPMLCARVFHPRMQEREVYSQVWNTFKLVTLSRANPEWQEFTVSGTGWFVAKPAYSTPATRLEGYFLNLFDLVDRQHVEDNVIRPLTAPDINLGEALTVPMYVPPAMESTSMGEEVLGKR